MAGPPVLVAGRTVRKTPKSLSAAAAIRAGRVGRAGPRTGDDPRDVGHKLVRVLSPPTAGGRWLG
jgi:hypothetical protein